MNSDEELQETYELLAQGNPAKAIEKLSKSIPYELGNQEVEFTTWCCTYWSDIVQELESLELFEQSESLIFKWKQFMQALQKKSWKSEKALYAVQKGIFSLALDSCLKIKNVRDDAQKAELNLKMGMCSKKLGKYEEALDYLSEANRLFPSSPDILAEMADCYALCGEDKNAKVLFREAFFIDAQKIDLAFLDSELICSLIRAVQDKGYRGQALQEWIAVYGVLYGVLNVKRELRSTEIGKLNQEIYAMENELRDPSSNSAILTPKLINKYFWLIDYYVRLADGSTKINEKLLRIKILDRNIYDLYVK